MPSNTPHSSGSVVLEETARRAQVLRGWAVACSNGDLEVVFLSQALVGFTYQVL